MDILSQLILNSLIAGAIYTMVALGFTLVFKVTKFFNLAHGALLVVGAYTLFYFAEQRGWNLFLAIILAIGLSAILGFLINKFIYQPLRNRKSSTLILLVTSLGVFTVIQAIVAMLFTSQFQSLSDVLPNQNVYHIGTGVITALQLWTLVVGISTMCLLALILSKTKFGKSVVAISDDEEVSKIIGINTNKIVSIVFLIGSALAGFAGVLFALDNPIEPSGLALLLKGIIAAVIGGLGDVYGAVLGAFLLAFVENFGIWKISGEWKDAIAFGLLIVFLIFRPQGIISK